LAEAYEKIGVSNKAKECYNKAYELEKEYIEGSMRFADSRYLKRLGDHYFNEGDYISAIEYYQKALKVDPTVEVVQKHLKLVGKLIKKSYK